MVSDRGQETVEISFEELVKMGLRPASLACSNDIGQKLRQANEKYALGGQHREEALGMYMDLERQIWDMEKGTTEYMCALECCASIIRMGHDIQTYRILFHAYADDGLDKRMISESDVAKLQYRQKHSKRFSERFNLRL
ncbi:hypothetical protein KY311_02260 [Candidatus Woesearchaeota archaeon]|nr:hypothetical protein [Candidatus Woesearchaeota archaeon]